MWTFPMWVTRTLELLGRSTNIFDIVLYEEKGLKWLHMWYVALMSTIQRNELCEVSLFTGYGL